MKVLLCAHVACFGLRGMGLVNPHNVIEFHGTAVFCSRCATKRAWNDQRYTTTSFPHN